ASDAMEAAGFPRLSSFEPPADDAALIGLTAPLFVRHAEWDRGTQGSRPDLWNVAVPRRWTNEDATRGMLRALLRGESKALGRAHARGLRLERSSGRSIRDRALELGSAVLAGGADPTRLTAPELFLTPDGRLLPADRDIRDALLRYAFRAT